MTGCIWETATAALAAWLFCKVKTDRDRRRSERVTAVSQLCQQFLGHDAISKVSVTNAEINLPLGADVHAAAALQTVLRYQKEAAANEWFRSSTTAPSSPSDLPFWATMLLNTYGSCIPWDDSKPDANIAICEELKPWLTVAASSGVSREDVTTRLEFCHQLLMRHELFLDTSFLEALAAVCEHLDRMSEQMAGSIRTCVVQFARIENHARALVANVLPILLFAIGDAVKPGTLGYISVNGLQASAAREPKDDEGAYASQDPYSGLWRRDLGRIMRELLFSPHCQELFGCESVPHEGTHHGVLGLNLELGHKWRDAINAKGTVEANSGLSELFQAECDGEAQAALLDLFVHLDNFIKFVSLLHQYSQMADIAGDAAMFRLRMPLHHLLQELEMSLVQCGEHTSRLLYEANRKVVLRTSTAGYFEARETVWVERLRRFVDGQEVSRIAGRIFEEIHELRDLSSEARLPELAQSCQVGIQQLIDLAASREFKDRCVKPPPEMDTLLALRDETAAIGALATAPAYATSDSLAGVSGTSSLDHPSAIHPASPLPVVLAVDAGTPKPLADGVADEGVLSAAIPAVEHTTDHVRAHSGDTDGALAEQALHEADRVNSVITSVGIACESPGLIAEADDGVRGQEVTDEAIRPEAVPSTTDTAKSTAVDLKAEEALFYQKLWGAMMVFRDDPDEILSDGELKKIIDRAGLAKEDSAQIVLVACNMAKRAKESQSDETESQNEEILRLVGKMVARAQSTQLPEFRGIKWTGKKMSVEDV